jgi:hypothetical protein
MRGHHPGSLQASKFIFKSDGKRDRDLLRKKWKIFPLYLTLFNRVASSPTSKPATLLAAIATSQALATLEHWQCCHSRALFVKQKLICCPLSSEAFVALYTREVGKITTGSKRSGQFLLGFCTAWACHTELSRLFGYWNLGKQLRVRGWHIADLNPCLQSSSNWQHNCHEAQCWVQHE